MDTADLIASPAGGSHRNYRLWEDELEPLPEPDEIKEVSYLNDGTKVQKEPPRTTGAL